MQFPKKRKKINSQVSSKRFARKTLIYTKKIIQFIRWSVSVYLFADAINFNWARAFVLIYFVLFTEGWYVDIRKILRLDLLLL